MCGQLQYEQPKLVSKEACKKLCMELSHISRSNFIMGRKNPILKGKKTKCLYIAYKTNNNNRFNNMNTRQLQQVFSNFKRILISRNTTVDVVFHAKH